jgi:hypothetical protein
MNIFKKLFHKHEFEDVSCPFTMKTYTMCKHCNKKLGWRLTNG